MSKQIILIFLIFIIYSCTLRTSKEINDLSNKVIINADSCKNWGLQPVNFEIRYPDNYIAELNSFGGFYLQLRKLNGDTIIHEISFGVSSELSKGNLKDNLYHADSIMKKVFVNANQEYTTDYIGIEEFLGKEVDLARATIKLSKLPREGLIGDGKYSTIMTCLFSEKTTGQGVMVSIVSSLNEQVDNKNNLALENKKILETFKIY